MARAAAESAGPPSADGLDDVAPPWENLTLIGHNRAERELLDAYAQGRIHHAWLFVGPRGVGRATTAFRLARFLLAYPDPHAPQVQTATSLAVPDDHPVVRRVAAKTHSSLLHIQREWDDKAKRFKTDISVDVVRRVTPFFGTTSGEGGWRVVIVDPADAMNRNAANALLKTLEEPPKRAMLILIAETLGRLPPTIRSRCRVLPFGRLDDDGMAAVLETAGAPLAVGEERRLALALAQGSPRAALELLREDGLALYRQFAATLSSRDPRAFHAIAELAAAPSAYAAGRLLSFFGDYCWRRASLIAEPLPDHRPAALPLATWVELWEKAVQRGREADSLNLDRRELILDLLEAYAQARTLAER